MLTVQSNMGKSIEQMHIEKQKGIKDAISRKEKSIAYFNSVNAAIQLICEYGQVPPETSRDDYFQEEIPKWRDWFYEEWCNWYLDSMPVNDVYKTMESKYSKPTVKRAIKSQSDQDKADDLQGQIPTINV